MYRFLKLIWKNWLLVLIILIGIFIRFYRLDEIPGEIWGDITVGFDYTKSVLQGEFPLYFILADGPLFFYLVAFFSLIFGLSFLTLKLTTLFLGILLIILVYLLVKEALKNKTLALISAYLVAVSKWPLVYSRLGNLQIIVPVLVISSFIFFLKSIKTQKLRYFVFSGLLLGIGMYSHPGFFVTPIMLAVCYLYWFFKDCPEFMPTVKKLFIAFLVAFIVFLPMKKQFFKQQGSLFSPQSYFGEKFYLPGGSIRSDWLLRLIGNVKRAALAFHVKGDIVFRENPPFDPHLDRISGIFFLLGILWWLTKKKALSFYLFFPFVFLQVPMILVINQPVNVPSAGRSIAIMPFVLIFTGTGIWFVYNSLKKKRLIIANTFLIFILALIQILNFEKYFVAYAQGLPHHNTPFGKIIAQEIDKQSEVTQVYVYGCCWGDWGQPEPKGIEYALKSKRKVVFFHPEIGEEFDCQKFRDDKIKKMVIWDPRREKELIKLKRCLPDGQQEIFKSQFGDIVFIGYYYPRLKKI